MGFVINVRRDSSIYLDYRGEHVVLIYVGNYCTITRENFSDLIATGGSAVVDGYNNALRCRDSYPFLRSDKYYLLMNRVSDELYHDKTHARVLNCRKHVFKQYNHATADYINEMSITKHRYVDSQDVVVHSAFAKKMQRIIEIASSFVESFDIAGKTLSEWASNDYIEHIREAALVFPFLPKKRRHIEFSAGLSVVQPLLLPETRVVSVDSSPVMVSCARQLGHRVVCADNSAVLSRILDTDVVWINYTTDDNPTLPVDVATQCPKASIVVIDTKFNFVGAELYQRVTPDGNVYVRNVNVPNIYQRHYKRIRLKWSTVFLTDDVHYIADKQSYELVKYNQRFNHHLRVSSDNPEFLVGMSNIEEVRRSDTCVISDPVPRPYFSRQIWSKKGVRFRGDTVHYCVGPTHYCARYGSYIYFPRGAVVHSPHAIFDSGSYMVLALSDITVVVETHCSKLTLRIHVFSCSSENADSIELQSPGLHSLKSMYDYRCEC